MSGFGITLISQRRSDLSYGSGVLKFGPFSQVEFGGSIKECRKIDFKAKGCIGPVCIEENTKNDQWQPRSGKAETDPRDFKNAWDGFKDGLGFTAEGKLAANFCAAGKW